jgi:hypothetical protein
MPTTMHRPLRSETRYPTSYRTQEVDQIVRAIRARHSAMVCGLGGSGKSHLLRFLAFHPGIEERLGAPDLRRLYLDCNAAVDQDAAGIFRALLLESGAHSPIPAEAPDMLVALRSRLAEGMSAATRVVCIIDRFERIAPTVQPAVLDGLRHLRDYLDRRVSYVLGSRAPLPIAELSEEFDDLLAEPPVVWVGPLAPADAEWNLQAIFQEVGIEADVDTRHTLIAWSSGHPRLLRTLALAWAQHAAVDQPPQPETLLRDRHVARVCDTLYRELDPKSQTLLCHIAAGEQRMVLGEHVLRRAGLVHDAGNGQPELASSLLKLFLQAQQQAAPFDLTALEQQLWEIVSAQPHMIHTRDDLIAALYGDTGGGINDEALTALVARLRRKLVQADTGTLEAVRGRGYRFIPADRTDGMR